MLAQGEITDGKMAQWITSPNEGVLNYVSNQGRVDKGQKIISVQSSGFLLEKQGLEDRISREAIELENIKKFKDSIQMDLENEVHPDFSDLWMMYCREKEALLNQKAVIQDSVITKKQEYYDKQRLWEQEVNRLQTRITLLDKYMKALDASQTNVDNPRLKEELGKIRKQANLFEINEHEFNKSVQEEKIAVFNELQEMEAALYTTNQEKPLQSREEIERAESQTELAEIKNKFITIATDKEKQVSDELNQLRQQEQQIIKKIDMEKVRSKHDGRFVTNMVEGAYVNKGESIGYVTEAVLNDKRLIIATVPTKNLSDVFRNNIATVQIDSVRNIKKRYIATVSDIKMRRGKLRSEVILEVRKLQNSGDMPDIGLPVRVKIKVGSNSVIDYLRKME